MYSLCYYDLLFHTDFNPVTNSPIPGGLFNNIRFWSFKNVFLCYVLVDNGCKQKSGTFSTDLFPDYPKYRLAKDLDTFVSCLNNNYSM